MKHYIDCTGRLHSHLCGADLLGLVRGASKATEPGTETVRVKCNICGQWLLVSVDWNWELVVKAATVVPEEGK